MTVQQSRTLAARSPKEAPGKKLRGCEGCLLFCAQEQASKGERPKADLLPPEEDEHEGSGRMGWCSLQLRRMRTLYLAGRVFVRLRRCRAQAEAMEEEEAEEAWERFHEATAPEVRRHAEQWRGFLVKACQSLSSRADFLPEAYLREFAGLTDNLPQSHMDEVRRVFLQDLGRPLEACFEDFEPEAIGSASIAQVHRARLRGPSGQAVAVKVQHEGVDCLMRADLDTLGVITEKFARWEPAYDLRPVHAEWKAAGSRELDFREERAALERGRRALEAAGSTVRAPRSLPELSSRRVLTMDFVEGLPLLALAEPGTCARLGVDKRAVVDGLVEAFGHLIFREGFYHVDPHPGNILVQPDASVPGGAAPVLIDWGLTRELTRQERLGLARAFHAIANFDAGGLFAAMGQLGYRFTEGGLKDADRQRLFRGLRAGLSSTMGRAQTRQQVLERRREDARAARQEKESGKEKEEQPAKKEVEEWPGVVLFLLRTMGILRGIAVSLDVEGVAILAVWARHARAALVEASAATLVQGTPLQATSCHEVRPEADTALELRIVRRLRELSEAGRIVGAQVAVVASGRLVCDVATGTRSAVDVNPVDVHTRFPLIDAAPAVATWALLRRLRDRGLSLHHPVAGVWRDFGGGGSGLSLADLLGHRAGVQDAFPTGLGPQFLADEEAMRSHLENSQLQQRCPTRVAYLLQGHVLAGLARKGLGAAGGLHEVVEEHLASLGFDGGIASTDCEAYVSREVPELSRVSAEEAARHRRAQRKETAAAAAESTANFAEQEAGCAQGVQGLLAAFAADPSLFDPLQGPGGSGPELAGLPTRASARGLARTLASAELVADLRQLDALEPAGEDNTALGWLLSGGAGGRTSGGFQELWLRPRGARRLCCRRRAVRGYGFVSIFGPLAAHFPAAGKDTGGVTVAVTLNGVLHGRTAAAELLGEVLEEEGLGSYAPTWADRPLHLALDMGRLAAAEELQPLRQLFSHFGHGPAQAGRMGPRKLLAALFEAGWLQPGKVPSVLVGAAVLTAAALLHCHLA